jgi:hypothetical protein
MHTAKRTAPQLKEQIIDAFYGGSSAKGGVKHRGALGRNDCTPWIRHTKDHVLGWLQRWKDSKSTLLAGRTLSFDNAQLTSAVWEQFLKADQLIIEFDLEEECAYEPGVGPDEPELDHEAPV